MCFLFQSRDDLVETLDICSADAMDHGAFQRGEMTLNSERKFLPFCGWSHHECAAICFAHCACDQSTLCETIENAGQRRPLVRKAAMEMGYVGGAGMRQKR